MKTLKKSILLLTSLVVAVSAASCINDELTEPQKEVAVKELATVEEQAASMEATLADLEALQTSAEGLDEELASVVSSIENHIADLKSGASLLEGTLATLEMQKELAEVMAALEFGAEDTKGGAALTKAVASVDKKAESWLGKHFAAYYPAAKAEAAAAARLTALDLKTQKLSVEAILSDVEAGLRKNADKEELTALAAKIESNADEVAELLAALTETRTEVETEYAETVETAVTDPSGFDLPALKQFNSAVAGTLAEADNSLAGLIARVEACEVQLKDIKTRLGELESTVADLDELLDLIQSVTFMSEYSAENAIAYYTLGSESREDGKKVRNPQGTIDLRYVIRPASAAQALTASDLWDDEVKVFGYYANTITKAAPETFDFDITKVTADGAGNGIVTVTVSAALNESFYFKETGAKLALSIATGKTDLTSKFVEIVPKDQSGTVYLESLSLEKDEVELDEGDELNLKEILNPSNVTVKELTWTTDNSGIVSVSGSGRIKGESVGQATITVTSKGTDEWGRTLSASCTVKVNPAIKLSGPIYVEEGSTAQLSLDYPPEMLIESKVWSTSDNEIATVSDDAVVTGVANTYNQYTYQYNPVTVYCTINGNITVSHDVKVVVPQPRQVKFNNYADDVHEITMKVDESISLAGTILPETISDKFRLFYESTAGTLGWIDSSTGAINRSSITGTIYVYARVFEIDKNHYFAPGKSLYREMIVKVDPYWVETLTLPETMTLAPKATATLTPVFTSDVNGKQPTNKTLTWTSSNSSIVSVNATTGEMKALSEGTVTITAKTVSGAAANSAIKTATCVVTVKAPVAEVKVGDYYYSDGTWGSNPRPSGKSVIGVIFSNANAVAADPILMRDYPQCSNGLAVGLDEYTDQDFGSVSNQYGHGYYASLGYDASSIVSTAKTNGYGNTLAHRDLNASKSDYCKFFNASDGVVATHTAKVSTPSKSSSWYIPSYKEMSLLNDNMTTVNASLSTLGGTPIAEPYMYEDSWDNNRSSDWYWTSTIKGDWYESGGTYDHFKYPFDIYKGGWTSSQQSSAKCKVRVVLAF